MGKGGIVMKRPSACLLLTCFAFAGLYAGGSASAAPRHTPSALAFVSGDQDRETDKYNRKLHQLEIKRARDRQKLDAEYLKLFRRKKSMDLRELQKRLDKFQRKRDELEEKYYKELNKLEREWLRKG